MTNRITILNLPSLTVTSKSTVIQHLYLLDKKRKTMNRKQCIEIAKATNGLAESQDM